MSGSTGLVPSFQRGTPVPEGYQYADIPAAEVQLLLAYDEPEESSMAEVHNMCLEAIQKAGWRLPMSLGLLNCTTALALQPR